MVTFTNHVCISFSFQTFKTNTGKILYEGAILGHVGVFANDVPRVCGGRNFLDNLNKCYEFDIYSNK